jgi:DNA-binding beta-propeller fold protein YncE
VKRSMISLAWCLALVTVATAGQFLLVGNKSAHTLWALDLATGEKSREFATGHGPHEVAVSPDQRHAVVADYGTETPGHTLTVIDWTPAAAGATRTIDLGADTRPHGLAFLPDGRLTVTTEGSDNLLVVDIATGEVQQRIPVGKGIGHMVAVSPDGHTAWVTHIRQGTLTKIDLQTGATLGIVATGAGAEGVGVTRDGREVWVTNRADDTVCIVDAETLEILATLDSPGFPIRVAMSPTGRHALITNARAATLSVFDIPHRKLTATVDLAQDGVEYQPTLLGQAALPIGVTMTPDGSHAFVAISGADQIAVIDPQTWTITTHWPTGREPDALGVITTSH